MLRPPRDSRTDRLVSLKTVTYIGAAGISEALVCMAAYFVSFSHYGVTPSDLVLTADTYWKSDAPNFTASDGSVYDADAQVAMLIQAQTAWFAMLTTCQSVHIFMCKTRLTSLFNSELLWSNSQMNLSAIVEILLITIIVFTPISHSYFAQAPPGRVWYFLIFNFFIMILLNEPRKYFARRYPQGFVRQKLIF